MKKRTQQVSTRYSQSHPFVLAIFLVLVDENLEQVLANILQVKERGATCVVLTNLPDIYKFVKKEKIDFLVQLSPQPSILAALLASVPLLMMCYYTALAKGINPDKNIVTSINIIHQLGEN
jgi:glucosamine--fructose-6-phosphate aminotransferase (isomerizing)